MRDDPPAPGSRRFWGWGCEGHGPTPDQQRAIAQVLAARFGLGELAIAAPPRIDELTLPAPRLAPPAALAACCSTTPFDRAAHSYGKSFRDVVRAFRREYTHPPDVVAFPRSEAEVAGVLEWCATAGAAAIPPITIGPGETSLASIRDKINKSNAGVTATIISDADGARMVLTSKETGETQGFRLTATETTDDGDPSTGLSALNFTSASGDTMTSSQLGENAVAKYREVMGATNPAQAADGTIRKQFAESVGENTVHGSDSADNAKIEIAQFFTDADIVA